MKSRSGLTGALIASLLVSACGGGGSGSGDTPATPSGSSVTVLFPTGGEIQAESLTVSGVASDVSGTIAADSILVDSNGGSPVVATIDSSGHWFATLPTLDSDAVNTITATFTASEGDVTDSSSLSVSSTPVLVSLPTPQGVVFDEASNRLLVIDGILDALVAIDIATGTRTIISDDNDLLNDGAEVGTGPAIPAPTDLVLDSTLNRVLVLMSSDLGGALDDAIFEISLANGNRAVLSSGTLGTGQDFISPTAIAFDPSNDLAYVVDVDVSVADTPFIVDLGNGNRTAIPSDSDGDPNVLISPVAIALVDANTLLIVDEAQDLIVSIDLTTNARTPLVDSSGSGISIVDVQNAFFDADNNRLLLVDANTTGSLIAVDISSGARTLISGDSSGLSVGAGPAFGTPTGIALNATGDTSFVVDSSLDSLVFVDNASGDRSIQPRSGIGSGDAFEFLVDISIDTANSRAVVVDTSENNVIAVDLESRDRTVLSQAEFVDDEDTVGRTEVGTGPGLANPTGIVVDPTSGRIFVSDNNLNAIFEIDSSNGNRTIFSDDADTTATGDPEVGTGDGFSDPQSITVDTVNNRLLVTDDDLDAVIAVDLTSGNRTLLSANGVAGAGDAVLGTPADVLVDAANNRAFVAEVDAEAIIAIDLVSGDRTVFSDDNDTTNGGAPVGDGIAFIEPLALSLDSENGRLLVGDGAVRLIAVDLATGDRTLLSEGNVDPAAGSGDAFLELEELSEVIGNSVLALDSDALIDAVIEVGVIGGDRVVFSAD